MRVLAIDPGRDKCGAAAMDEEAVLAHTVISTEQLAALISDWSRRYRAERILVGDRTGSEEIQRIVTSVLPGVPVSPVAEFGTTLDARKRYFRDHPPRGWRRLIPITLLVPPEPFDDYAAIVLGERFIRDRLIYT